MKRTMMISAMALFLLGGLAQANQGKGDAAGDNKKMMEMTPDQREKMAAMHEKMAACLRSTKTMKDCRKEMMQTCHDSMGPGGCPMMEHHGMKHQMHESEPE